MADREALKKLVMSRQSALLQKDYDRNYYAKNSERIKDRKRKYYCEHKEIVKAKRRIKYALNREGERSKGRENYALHREKLNNRTRAYRKANPLKHKGHALKYRHGITLEDYGRMYDEQWGMCGICGTPGKSMLDSKVKTQEILYIDHCHRTKKVRGLLCNNCNSAIGLFREDIKAIENSLNYLKYFNE